MKNILLALTIALGSATAASAGALDAYVPQTANSAIDYTATASIGGNGEANDLISNPRLGDGSPVYKQSNAGVDFTATASIGGNVSDNPLDNRARLGDGSPSVY